MGKGDLKALKLSIMTTYILVLIVGGTIGILNYFFRDYIIDLYTIDPDVKDLCSKAMKIVSIDFFFGT